MKRRIFTLLSAGSLVLWLAVAVLFVRSFWVVDYWSRDDWDGVTLTQRFLWISGGRMSWWWLRFQSSDAQWKVHQNDALRQGKMGLWERDRGRFDEGDKEQWYRPYYGVGPSTPFAPGGTSWATILSIPAWPLLLLLAIAPALWLRRFRCQRRRRKLGLCPECGYDLRAHAPGQKCPECGLAIPADLVRKPMAP